MKIREGFTVHQDPTYGYYVAEAVDELKQQFPNAIQMGLPGRFLWDQLTYEDLDRTELILRLGNFYENGVDNKQLTTDVDMFIAFLKEQDIFEPEKQ